jgi:glycyl-tRNA synthetase
LEDNTVTIRDRDTMEQVRVNVADLFSIIDQKVNMRKLLV